MTRRKDKGEKKGPAGRPSLYTPERCAQVIAWMSSGYSVTGFAGKIGVCRKTVYQWAEDYLEFAHALNEGRAATAAFWEDRAVDVSQGGEGNASVVIFGLKNRAADEWRDKQSLEHSGPDGKPIQTVDWSKLDTDTMRKIMAARNDEPDES